VIVTLASAPNVKAAIPARDHETIGAAQTIDAQKFVTDISKAARSSLRSRLWRTPAVVADEGARD
jgi:hypothetical protein